MSDFGSVLYWWLLLQLVGLACLPLAYVFFRNISDRCLFLAKPLGILLLSYLVWIAGCAGIPFGRGTTWLAWIALVGVNIWLWRSYAPGLATFLKAQRGNLLFAEGIFFLAFLFWAIVRMFTPDITGTERYMDFAFMNSCYRSEAFPPHDPWLSGPANYINYYHFGYLIQAVLAKFAGLAPEVAFNLSMATLFALLVAGAYAVAYSLCRSTLWATVASLLTGVLGNLDAARQAFDLRPYLARQYGVEPHFLNLDLFAATRVVFDRSDPEGITKGAYNVISEVPIFSYLWGDMHPHVMAMPFTLLAVAIAFNFLRASGSGMAIYGTGFLRWLTLAGASLVIGSLWFMNSWDFPTYLGLSLVAIYLTQVGFGIRWPNSAEWVNLLAATVPLVIVSVVLYLPFTLHFHSPQKFGIWAVGANGTAQSKATQFLIVMGVPIVLLGTYLITRLLTMTRSPATTTSVRPTPPTSSKPRFCTSCGTRLKENDRFCGKCGTPLKVAGASAAVSITLTMGARELPGWMRQDPSRILRILGITATVLAVLGILSLFSPISMFVSALMVAGIAASLFLFRHLSLSAEEVFGLLLLCGGAALVLFCEHLFLKDIFGNRMNTIFKFYIQAWVLWGVASGIALRSLSERLKLLAPTGRKVAWGIVASVLVLAAFFPVMGVVTQTHGFSGEPTLNGLRYMATYHPEEYDAIQWARNNVKDLPVILEAKGADYSDYGRVSANTGFPTVIGWEGHEDQWRQDWRAMDGARMSDVDTIYQTADPNQARALLSKYGVGYIWVGRLEKEKYGSSGGLAKFAGMCRVAYQNGGVAIYQFNG